jgi:hypothetical protein
MVKKGMTAAQIAKKIGMKEKDVAEFMKSMDETKESVELDEAKKIKFSAKEIKMAIGIATDKRYAGTNYSGAARMIDKIKDGLSDFPQVAAVLKRANESVVELDEAASLIPQLQTIVQDKQHAKIKGMVVDLFTASMITQIYDKVNDANKAKMDKLPLEKLVNIAHKMMKREETLQTEVFVEGLIQESDKTDAKEMSDMVKTLNPKIKLADLKKEVQDIAMEKYKNKTRASKIASMVK